MAAVETLNELQSPPIVEEPFSLPLHNIIFSTKRGKGSEIRALSGCLAMQLSRRRNPGDRFDPLKGVETIPLPPEASSNDKRELIAFCSRCAAQMIVEVDSSGQPLAIAGEAAESVPGGRWNNCEYTTLYSETITNRFQDPVQVPGVEV